MKVNGPYLKETFRGQRRIVTQVIEVTVFACVRHVSPNVTLELGGHLEATMASEATIMAVKYM